MSKFQLIISNGQYETVLPFNSYDSAIRWMAAAITSGELEDSVFNLIER